MRSNKLSFWLVCLLTALAIGLALLQMRWIGELSRLEGEQLQRALQRQSNLVGRAFERELSRLLLAFPGPNDVRLQQQLVDWRSSGSDLDLLLAVYRYDFLEEELFEIQPQISDRRTSAQPIDWPADLEALRQPLAQTSRALRNRRIRDPRGIFAALGGSPLIAAGPVLVRPLAFEQTPFSARRRNLGRPAQRPRPSLLVLHIDGQVLRETLSRFVYTRLDEDLGLRFDSALFDNRGELVGTIRNGEWIEPEAQSREQLQRTRRRYREAIKVPLVSARAFVNDARLRALLSDGRGAPPAAGNTAQLGDRRGPWVLAVRMQEGTVRSTIARQRIGSLLLAGLMVLLLAASGIMLYRNTRRAEDFARRQTDFVASISHEMHTPLAAISSAGANLADGVIEDPTRIRQYGQLLQKEGNRLARTVGQALALAGVESSASARRNQAGSLLLGVEQAVEETRLLAEQVDGEVVFQREQLERAPSVALHHEDLVRVLENLLQNAFKYGARQVIIDLTRGSSAEGHPAEISNAPTVGLHVEDDGPGIPKQDRERIWEPFRRGRQRTESALSGSGLGLYLVKRILEQAGATIRLREPRELGGAHFELDIPVASAQRRVPLPRRQETHPSQEPR